MNRTRVQVTAIICTAVVLSFLALYPVVTLLAGHDTKVSVGVTLSLTAVMTLTAGGAAMWGRHHRSRANNAEGRAEGLEGRVRTLQDEKKALSEQVQALESDLKGVRGDLGRIRNRQSP